MQASPRRQFREVSGCRDRTAPRERSRFPGGHPSFESLRACIQKAIEHLALALVDGGVLVSRPEGTLGQGSADGLFGEGAGFPHLLQEPAEPGRDVQALLEGLRGLQGPVVIGIRQAYASLSVSSGNSVRIVARCSAIAA